MALGLRLKLDLGAGRLGGIVTSIKWLLGNYLNLRATVGPSAVAGGTSGTWIEVWDQTLGKLLELFPAGIATSPGQRGTYDVDEGATLSAELNTNPAGWVIGAGWTNNTDGTYTCDGTNTVIFTGTASIPSAGHAVISFDVLAATEGQIRPILNGTPDVTGTQVSAVDSYTETLIGTVDTNGNVSLQSWFGFIGTVGNISIKQITPTFKNTVSKADSTKLHPTKEGANGSTVFFLHDYWPGAAQGVSAGAKIYVIGTDGHNYSLSTVAGGTTDSAIPAVETSDIGGTVADNDITWNVDRYYSNLADGTASGNYLPHVLSEVEAINRGLYARDFTQAEWVKTTMTAAKDQTGFDGSANGASSLLATAGNATALQTYTVASAEFVSSCDVKRLTGTGTVEFTVDGGTTWTDITTNLSTSQWFRAEATKTAANPEYGFRIVTDTDKIAVDFGGVELGSVASSRTPTTNSAVTRDATEFLVTPTTAAFLRLRVADVNPQTFLLSGTIVVSYDGTDLTWTDGTNAMVHTVAMAVGDFAVVEEATGKLYFNGSLVDTNGSYSPSWGEIALGNAVDYQFSNDIDPTDQTWQEA